MVKFNIFSDGSYRNGLSGYGIKVVSSNDSSASIIAFGSQESSDCYEGELIAIEMSLIVFKEHILNWLSEKEFKIEIHSDSLSIVNKFKSGGYKYFYNSFNNSNNVEDIKKNKIRLFELVKLVETFPKGSISFTKSKKNNDNLKVAHRFARFALKNNCTFYDECYCIKGEYIKNDLNLITTYKSINEIDIGLIKKMIQSKIRANEDSAEVATGTTGGYENNNIFIPVNRVIVSENTHLDCMNLHFDGKLRRFMEVGEIKNPIFIKKMEDKSGYFSLVSGAIYLFSAKILGLEKIPAIVTELTTEEFNKTYSL